MSSKDKAGKKGRTPEPSSRNPSINSDETPDLERGKKKKSSKRAPVVVHASGAKKTSPFTLALILGGFVFCGTCSTVLGKVLFQSRSIGIDGQEKQFEKPLFQNTGMFVGMSLCLLVFEINRRFCLLKGSNGEKQPLMGGHHHDEPVDEWKVYYVVLVPAICDFIATYMMNVGLLWINASVWQMLRGSIVLFAAFIRWFWLGRRIHNYQWFGVLVVMSALGIIGFSCIMNSSSVHRPGEPIISDFQKGLGVFLVFSAQLVQATQTVVEEHLLHDIKASDMQIVGLEGVWGLALCVGVAMPVAAYIPVAGLHEDTWDTLEMMRNSVSVEVLFTLYVIVILGYNMFAMKTTMYLNSVTRNIIDTVRTIFIWTVLTVIHYVANPSFGEPWSQWSYVQLFGFGVLISGLFTYYQVFTLPCFEYPPEEKPAPVTSNFNTPTPGIMDSPRI